MLVRETTALGRKLAVHSRSPALPGNALHLRLCLEVCRQSLGCAKCLRVCVAGLSGFCSTSNKARWRWKTPSPHQCGDLIDNYTTVRTCAPVDYALGAHHQSLDQIIPLGEWGGSGRGFFVVLLTNRNIL